MKPVHKHKRTVTSTYKLQVKKNNRARMPWSLHTFMMTRCHLKSPKKIPTSQKNKQKFLFSSSTETKTSPYGDNGLQKKSVAKKARLQRILLLKRQGRCFICKHVGHTHANCPKKYDKSKQPSQHKFKAPRMANLTGI